MASSIKEALKLDAELIEGSNGIFDIVADGELIFSKHEEQRFPEHQEIIDKLRTGKPISALAEPQNSCD